MKNYFRKFCIIFDIEKIDSESQKSALLVSWFPSFGKRYEIELRFIFYQWPKLDLGLDGEDKIHTLKVI